MGNIQLIHIIGVIVFIVVLLPYYLLCRLSKQIKKISNKNTDELKSIISENRNIFIYGAAIKELKCRNEDYSAVLPNLIELATSSKKVERILGWSLIKEHFPQIEKEVEFDCRNPSDASILKLKSLSLTNQKDGA